MTVAAFYLIASIVTFVAYRIDKAAAQANTRRTPELTLQLLALVGGWPGALVAQRVLHHKTRKLSFQVVFWICVVLNSAVLAALWRQLR